MSKCLVAIMLLASVVAVVARPMQNRNAYGIRGTSPYWVDPFSRYCVAKWDFESTNGTNVTDATGNGRDVGVRGGATGRFPAIGTNKYGVINYGFQSLGGGQTYVPVPTASVNPYKYTIVFWEKGDVGSYNLNCHWSWSPLSGYLDFLEHDTSRNCGFAYSKAMLSHAAHSNDWCLSAQTVTYLAATNVLISAAGYAQSTDSSFGPWGSPYVFYMGRRNDGYELNHLFDRFAIYTNINLSSNQLMEIYNNTHPTNNLEWR